MSPTSHSRPWRVQFFSNLRKHGGTVSNLCSARRENVVEKVSPSSRTTTTTFFLFHLSHIFSFYPSTLEIAELCFETTASHSTIILSAWLFRFSPFSRSRHRLCQRAAPNRPFALRGHVTSFFMKMKFIWFCLRKTISGSYLKQNNTDLVFQTRTIFWKWVSSNWSRDQNVIFKIINYLFLNTNFALKLQGKCWKDDALKSTAHLSVTIKRLTRYNQKVVLAAMLEGKSMPSNMSANTLLKNQSAIKYLP